jgi:hypothetical protein
LPEGLADALAGELGVRVPIELAHQLTAVLVAEVEGDVSRVELEDLPGVPAEVVAGRGVEVGVAEAGGRGRESRAVRDSDS